jgi:hypothetical protein
MNETIGLLLVFWPEELILRVKMKILRRPKVKLNKIHFQLSKFELTLSVHVDEQNERNRVDSYYS